MAEQIPDGGPAFPSPGVVLHDNTQQGAYEGMTLRDYFATNAPTDEVQELDFRHLSRTAQEAITGLSYPQKPMDDRDVDGRVAFQIAEFEFKCQVNAAIRFKLADAMLRARKGGAT